MRLDQSRSWARKRGAFSWSVLAAFLLAGAAPGRGAAGENPAGFKSFDPGSDRPAKVTAPVDESRAKPTGDSLRKRTDNRRIEGTMLVGRVLNQASGNFLTNAKVLIEGTNLEALTTDTGEFQFTHLPAGELRIVASFTGFKSVAKMVTVAPGSVVREDFELNLIMLTKRCTIYADVRNFLGVPYMWGTWSPDTPEYARVDNSYYSSSTFSMGVKGSF